jgi:hypothetical protein
VRSIEARKRTQINAVHEDDVQGFLESVGAANTFADGSLKCVVCGRPVREAGVGAATVRDSKLIFCCARLDCVREFS